VKFIVTLRYTITHKPLTLFTGTKFNDIQQHVIKFLKRQRYPPDFNDYRNFLRKIQFQDNGTELEDTARDLGITVSRALRRRNQTIAHCDFHQLIRTRCNPDDILLQNDPALHDENLQTALKNNERQSKLKLKRLQRNFKRQTHEHPMILRSQKRK